MKKHGGFFYEKTLFLCCIFLCIACVMSVPCAAETEPYALNDYDLRAGVLPNGWTIVDIIEQSQAEQVYHSIETSFLEDGVTC